MTEYTSPWAIKKKFTDLEIAIMEGGNSIEPAEPKMSFIKELTEMRATEFITERLDYGKYIPVIKSIVSKAFAEAQGDEYADNAAYKIKNFLYTVGQEIDKKVMDKVVKEFPMVVDGLPIVSLSLNFVPTFRDGPESLSMGTLSAHAQRKMKTQYPGAELGQAGVETTAKYIRSHVNFLGAGDFNVNYEAKSAIIKIDAYGYSLTHYLFNAPHTDLVNASLDTLTSNIMAIVFHEIKHYMQGVKTKTHSQKLNRFYTGDPKKMDKQHHYSKTKSGYWLNAEEMSAWAANAAAQIVNVFGNDVQAMSDYIGLVAKGQTLNYNGVPVETALNVYQRQIFNKRYKMNTDRNVLWKKFLKDVYRDLQMHLTSQKQPSAQR